MREGDEERVAVHEAGHAVAYLVFGRPIERAIVALDEHQVDPVPGTAVAYDDEAVAMVAGWAAEEQRLRLNGANDLEILNAYMNGGQHDDSAKLASLAEQVGSVSIEVAEERAGALIRVHWTLVQAVADALIAEVTIDQNRLVSLGLENGVKFVPGDPNISRSKDLV